MIKEGNKTKAATNDYVCNQLIYWLQKMLLF